MQHTTTKNTPLSDSTIIDAFLAATQAEKRYVAQAVTCGQMLLEKRADMMTCHDGKSLNWTDKTKPESEQFLAWMKSLSPEIPERTAYRWMEAAGRVMCIILELHHSEPPVRVILDGEEYSISYALTAPVEDCSPAMLSLRDGFERYLADKTLVEAAKCSLNGCSEPHRITRAANGKRKGGAGGNRRDYAHFLAVHFKEASQSILKWDKLILNNPSQHAKMAEAIRATILGGPLRMHEKGRPVDLKPWPESFSKLMAGVLKERLNPPRE
jgi:hypothetical protein